MNCVLSVVGVIELKEVVSRVVFSESVMVVGHLFVTPP